jgi:hypothetical protein
LIEAAITNVDTTFVLDPPLLLKRVGPLARAGIEGEPKANVAAKLQRKCANLTIFWTLN